MSMCSVGKTNENASLTAILLNSQSDLHPKFGCRTCGLTRFVSGLRFIFSLSLFIFFASPRRPDRRLKIVHHEKLLGLILSDSHSSTFPT